MPNPDEIIELGIQTLKTANPNRNPAELIALSKRRERKALLAKRIAAIGTFAAGIAIGAIALRPESAMAILNESFRLSSSAPVVHIHVDVLRKSTEPVGYAWPPQAALDLWRLSDRYIRKSGHILYEAFRSGRTLAYDDRFATGYEDTYDPAKDLFWKFDGTIGLALKVRRSNPEIETVIKSGAQLLRYEWAESDKQHTFRQDLYVDPQSKLIRNSEDHWVDTNGGKIDKWLSVQYPSRDEASRAAPQFPKGLHFDTKKKLIEDFDHSIGEPDASAVVGGVRVTLYGVIVYPNSPDGLGILVITKGSGLPALGAENGVKIEDAQLLPAKRLQYFEPTLDPARTREGSLQTILGKKYLVFQSEDLLIRAPRSLALKVPVWHGQKLVGYAGFTTSKLYYNTGGGEWNFY